MNIVLIGMPGAGKSTVGVVLAKALNFGFLDSDLVIQQKTGRLLHKIIAEDGIDVFIATENRVVSDISIDNTVIATGGSVVYGAEAMANLKRNGKVVYIKVLPDELEKRIDNITTRGIAMEVGETIADLYHKRAPLYEKYADIIIDTADCDLEATVGKIVSAIQVPRRTV